MRPSAFLHFALTGILVAAPVNAQDPPAGPPGLPVAAGPGRIAGTVSDTAGEPLGNATITLRSAGDSALVTGALTEQGGSFRIEGLAEGDYVLRVSLIGYKPRNSEVISLTAAAPTVDLGTIPLELSVLELDAIEAAAERSAVVVEADRTVYNTKAMPVAGTGTATDVLRAVPELEVDVDDNVKLRGNQPVAIHLNGRPAPLQGEQLANFLRQLPGNRIERVEVMPNPSARHDPEGMGGIVNIVLQDDLDLGVSGSLTANMSTRNRQSVNGRLNLQKGRITLFSGGGIGLYRNDATFYDLRQNLVATPVTVIEQNNESDNRSRGLNADWTAELKVGEQGTVWSNAWIYSSGNDSRGLTQYGIMDEARTTLDSYDRENDSDNTWGSYNFGFGFKQIVEAQKEELTIDGRISRGVEDSETRNTRLFEILGGEPVDLPLELTLHDIDAGNGTLSIQADYFRPIVGGRLDVGYRAYEREHDNDNQLRIFDSPEASEPGQEARSGYDYREVFHSFYGTYGHTWGKVGFQAGLRAELSSTHFESLVGSDDFDRSYNTLFPSFNLSYTPVQGRTVRLLYSKRIRRPSAYYLDPYVPSTDPLNISIGNPDLRPSYMHSYSLDFSWTGSMGTLRVAPYYRTTSDIWERIRTVDTEGVATSRWENAATAKAYGSSFTVSLRGSGRLSGSTTFSVYRDDRDGTNISSAYRRAATLWSLGGNLGVKVTPTLTAQIFANHFPTQSILQGRASGYTFTSVSLRQQLWGTKGTVSLNVSDPLNLYRYDSSTRDATHIQTSRSSFQTRVVTVGFTFNFGKAPEQQSRRSQGEETGETIRVR
jgi:outer membrane receptor protein involved in Fe transport